MFIGNRYFIDWCTYVVEKVEESTPVPILLHIG